MTVAFMSFGFSELLLVGVIALLVFGGNLPDVMRTLGRSYAKLRQSLNEFSAPVRQQMREVTKLPSADSPPVPRGDDAPLPEYPDHYADADALDGDVPEAEAGEEADTDVAAAPPKPRTEPDFDFDEPPPV